jgi:uncharacterized membrane protein
MSFCKSCGNELPEGNVFCLACGESRHLPETSAGASAAAVMSPDVTSNTQPMATNVAGALAYLAGFITGIIFLAVEPYKNNSVIRFHAYQSIFFNVAWLGFWIAWMIVSAVLTPLTAGIFGLIAIPLIFIFALLGFGLWLFLMYQAYQQKLFRLPFIGKLAAEQAGVKP